MCWRRATRSIGMFDVQLYYCNKHWTADTEKMARKSYNSILGDAQSQSTKEEAI